MGGTRRYLFKNLTVGYGSLKEGWSKGPISFVSFDLLVCGMGDAKHAGVGAGVGGGLENADKEL